MPSEIRTGVLLALLASAVLNAQPVSYILFNTVSTGTHPDSLAIADLNGDGIPDLVVANQVSCTLTVLRGVGDGFFEPFFGPVTTGQSPRAVAVGDFNRDGKLDLAVANFASNSVSIFLGNGNGTFRAPTNLAATGPSAIAVGDFNADGKLDLAVVETNSNSVSIFLGNGDGTFLQPSSASTGKTPVSIAAADFNADGKLDLAVANSASNDVSILLGNGDGSFQAARSFDAGQLPAYIALGDFNGDGKIDLAVANATGFTIGTISVLLGLGNGIFEAPRSFTAGSDPSFLVAGDFNLDGKIDLAVANTGSNTISIFSGIGDGTFLPPVDFTVGAAPAWIGVTDLNADGKPDLLVANSASGTVSVLINHTGTLSGLSQPSVSSAVSAASFEGGPVAPGELVTIFGSNLGPSSPAGPHITAAGLLATGLAETQVLFDGIPGPLLYAGPGQVTAIVPYAVAGHANTQLTVVNGGAVSSTLGLSVTNSVPALFSADSSGRGQAAAINQDGSINAVLNPAARGSLVVLYATGAGQTNPAGVDGLLATSVLPTPVLPVSVSMDGAPALVLYAGAAPGLVAGVLQVNVLVPSGISTGAVPVVLQVGTAVSQSGITLSVQ
jgi:uncharacterized protein (TIGR03437 family)